MKAIAADTTGLGPSGGVDDHLADHCLADRLAGTNVAVVQGDATDTGLATDRFSAATCFSMLHHVPSAQLQDQLLQELNRVTRPGAILFGTDSVDAAPIRDFHSDDVFVLVDPDTFCARKPPS